MKMVHIEIISMQNKRSMNKSKWEHAHKSMKDQKLGATWTKAVLMTIFLLFVFTAGGWLGGSSAIVGRVR